MIADCRRPGSSPIGNRQSSIGNSCYPVFVRILAVDFGEKRIGLATSDATGTLATPRRTLARSDDARAAAEILRFCEEEEIGLILLGLPRSPEGVESAFAARIRSFASKLAAQTAIPVRFHEETLTS